MMSLCAKILSLCAEARLHPWCDPIVFVLPGTVQPLMQNRHMVAAVEIVVDKHLPVAVEVIADPFVEFQVVHVEAFELGVEASRKFLQGICIIIQTNE